MEVVKQLEHEDLIENVSLLPSTEGKISSTRASYVDLGPSQSLGCIKHHGYFNQWLMSFMVIIPILNFGMMMGWQSPITPLLQASNGPAPEPISDETISWMSSVIFVPNIFCSFVAGNIADRWGRKRTTLMSSLLLVVGWGITLFSLRPWALITSRVVAGIASSGCYVVTPLYLNEIASDEIRGALVSLFILSQNLGFLLIYVIGDLFSFTTVQWLCTLIPVVHLLLFTMMPETPVYLFKRGKIKEARAVLAWLRNTSVNDKDLDEEVKQLENEEEHARSVPKATCMNLIKDKTRFKAFRIAVVMMLVQESCGTLVFLMYASSIFELASQSISLKLSANKQTIFVGAIQFLGSVIASCVVEKIGRKRLLAGSSFTTACTMLALGLWFYFTAAGYWLPGWLPVLAMCICIMTEAAGFQPVPYIITTELFSFQYRSMVSSVVTIVDSFSDFMQGRTYEPLLKLLGIHWIFIIYSVICFFGTLHTILWVPETKGRTVEEIYTLLKDNRKKEKKKNGHN